MDQAESGIMGSSGRVDYAKKPALIFCTKNKEITFKDLSAKASNHRHTF
jgi:hypothetical protein